MIPLLNVFKEHIGHHVAKPPCQQTEYPITPFVLFNLFIERDNLSKVFHNKAPIISGLMVNLNDSLDIVTE